MKIYKVDDLQVIQAGQNYRHLGLFDQTGKQIIPFNPNKMPVAERLREIETRLLSPGLKDGYYIVKCKNSAGVKVATDDYTIYKGDQNLSEEAPRVIEIAAPQTFQPEVLTYDGALKLQIDLERLKMENDALKKEVENLKAEISEMEKSEAILSESDNSGMWENAKSFLSEIVSIGAPLLDKHFELREKQLSLKALEISRGMRGTNPGTNPQKNPVANPSEKNKQIIENWILSKNDDLNLYEELAAIYNEATSQEDFLKNLKEYDENLFKELTNGSRT